MPDPDIKVDLGQGKDYSTAMFVIIRDGQRVGQVMLDLDVQQFKDGITISPVITDDVLNEIARIAWSGLAVNLDYFRACLSILSVILYVLREGRVYLVVPGPPGGCQGKKYYQFDSDGKHVNRVEPPNEWPRAYLKFYWNKEVMIIMPQDGWAEPYNR